MVDRIFELHLLLEGGALLFFVDAPAVICTNLIAGSRVPGITSVTVCKALQVALEVGAFELLVKCGWLPSR